MALTKVSLVDLNAGELILDLNADTSITADTDDTIHFKIGGSDEITITKFALSPSTSDGNALGTSALEWSDLFLADGAVINFGDDQDVSLTHVADTGLLLSSTDKLQFGDSGTFIHQSSNGVLTIDGEVTIDLNASTAVLVSNDLKLNSDAAVLGLGADNDVTITHVADTGILINSDRKIQFSDATQFIHGLSDTVLALGATDEIDLTATAIDINGTCDISGQFSLGGTNVTTTAAELNLIDGGTARGTTAVASGDGILINDGGTMRMTNVDTVSTYFSSHSVGGSNIVTTGALDSGSITSGFGAINNGASAITTTGAITGGSLTVDDVAVNGKVITMTGSSGDTFTTTVGTNGATTLTTVDTAAAAANITITADGTAELAGTTVTLNSSGGVTLDADNGTITFADAGSSLGTITSSGYSGTAAVATTVTVTDNESTNENNVLTFVAGADADGGNVGLESDGDLTYNPNTGLLTTTKLDADGGITVDNITIDGTEIDLSSGSLTIDVAADIILDADGGTILFHDGGTHFGEVGNSSSDLVIKSAVSDKDMLFKGNDGGSTITALTLDMSEAGAATFNGVVYVSSGTIGKDATDYIGFTDNNRIDFTINGNNEFRFESDGDFHADADVIAYSTTVSDERLKENIQPIEDALSKVSQLNGVTFTYKADGKESAGLIAQDVEKVLPSAISEKQLPLKIDDGVEYKVLQYDQTIGLLVEAIKELTAKVEELESK